MLKDIEAKLPSGYRIDVGGAVEESDKANRALMAVVPGDAGHDPDDPDAAAAELLAHVHGVPHRAARTDRRRRRAAHLPGAARLRRDPRRHRAVRHDHAQRGDPGRPGADRDGRGPRPVERRGRSGRAPDPSGGADGGGHRARHDSAHAQRLLGPDGDRHHGRPHRRDGADDLLRAGALRRVVQGRARCAPAPAGTPALAH